jgi:sterol desaturase/sphingolipid hydroxylase (fatty acid hydroxylase superfamily)
VNWVANLAWHGLFEWCLYRQRVQGNRFKYHRHFPADQPSDVFWVLVLVLVSPAIHQLHFYVIHRAMHGGWLYKWVHSIHHNSVNPTPWSSLSMHPVVALFQLHMAGFGALDGHVGTALEQFLAQVGGR